jgi:hypothetical protein
MGMITQHQSMFFSQNIVKDLTYDENLPVTADYAFISQVIKNTAREKIIKLDFAICKFDMGGTNEQHRFKGLKEDFRIRKNIIQIPYLLNLLLYLLHYIHTLLKRLSPSVRFYRHTKNQHV